MNDNDLIKICVLLQTAYRTGYKREVNFITSFLLRNGASDLYFEAIEDNNKFNELNYTDELCFELVNRFNCGYGCFVVTGLKYDVLLDYQYTEQDLSVCSLLGIDKLFDLIPDSYFVSALNHDFCIDLLKTATKELLLDKTAEDLNKVFVDFAVYNKCSKVEDILFEYKDKYYLKYDVDSTEYSVVTAEDLKQFVIDFVDNMEYIEDFILLYEFIL